MITLTSAKVVAELKHAFARKPLGLLLVGSGLAVRMIERKEIVAEIAAGRFVDELRDVRWKSENKRQSHAPPCRGSRCRTSSCREMVISGCAAERNENAFLERCRNRYLPLLDVLDAEHGVVQLEARGSRSRRHPDRLSDSD
jgi:hypothetical protein